MAESLRQLIASFTVKVDEEGALRRGNAQVDALKANLQGLDARAKASASSVSASFSRMANGIRTPLSGGLPGAAGGMRPGLAVAANASGGLRASLTGMLSAISPVTLGIAGIGIAAMQASRAVVGLVNEMGGLGEQAARLGVTTAEFQRLNVLAKQNATSVQALGTAFRTVGKAAVDPTKETTEAFAKLGVTVRQSDGTFKSRSDLFFETAGALADITDENVRATTAQQLYGRSAIELLPLLANGRKGIEDQRAELMKLPIASESAIAAADRLSDRWETFGQVILGRMAPFLEEIAIPALETLTDAVLSGIDAVARFVKESGFLHYLTMTFRTMTTFVRIGMTTFKSLFGLLGSDGVSVFAKLASWVFKLGIAFQTLLMWPALLADDFQGFLQGKDSVIGRAIRGLESLFGMAAGSIKTAFSQAFDWLIQEALAVGARVADALTPDVVKFVLGAVGPSGSAVQTMAAPPSAIPQPAAPATSAAPTAVIGDTSITIVNPPPGEGVQMAGQVKGVLERGRDAILGLVQ